MDIKQNFSLLHYNTFGIDAKCKMFIEYDTLQELKSLVREYDLKNQLYLHIGGGSNLLFIHDFEGLVLHSRIQGIEIVDNSDTFVLLRVGAGVNWDDFVIYCVSHNLYGAENLSYATVPAFAVNAEKSAIPSSKETGNGLITSKL